MPTPAKQTVIEDLNGVFSKAKSAVLADYRGIKALEMTQFRKHMKERAIDFRVIKNTLAQRAAKDTPFEGLDSQFKGPVSLLVSYDDLVAPAKALAEYAKTGPEKNPAVLAGLVEGKIITPAEVKVLSNLPPKEVMIAQMLGAFQGPTTNFVGVFKSLLRKMVGTLDAIKEKKAQE